MSNPNLTDYVHTRCTLFERFVQAYPTYESQLYRYSNQKMIVLFTMLQFRRIFQFKAQWRWLCEHPEMRVVLGWERVPHRTTLSRRYKQFYPVVQAFVQFVGQYAAELDERFRPQHLVADKSPFKARGPVWHQSDRQAGRRPAKLRNLDTDARPVGTRTKSGYQGWVYGYELHITCNDAAFPALIQVETGAVAETAVIDDQEAVILQTLRPETLAVDNSYAQARRIRRWAKAGVVLLTPAYRWRKKPTTATSSTKSTPNACATGAPPSNRSLIWSPRSSASLLDRSNCPSKAHPTFVLVLPWLRGALWARFNWP